MVMKVITRACSLLVAAALLIATPVNCLAAGKFKISVKVDMDKFTKFSTAYLERDAELQLRELAVTDTKDYWIHANTVKLLRPEGDGIYGIGEGTAKMDADKMYYIDLMVSREDLDTDVPDIADVEFVLNGEMCEPLQMEQTGGMYEVALPLGNPKVEEPVKEVNISVEGGTATVSKTTIGGIVYIKADPSTLEKQFLKWEVVEGKVSWDSEDRPSMIESFFTVVSGDVKIKAVYKELKAVQEVKLSYPLDSIKGFKVGLSEADAQSELKKLVSDPKKASLNCSGDTAFLCYEKDGKVNNVASDGLISGYKHYLADLTFTYDADKYIVNDNTRFLNNGEDMNIFARYYFPGSVEILVEVTPEPGIEPPTPTPTPLPTSEVTPTPAAGNSMIMDFVERIYVNVLDRAPEAEGSGFWYNELYAFRRTGAEVAQGFIFSSEFDARKTDDKTFVSILYRTFFGREADEGGLDYWVGQLSSGDMDRATVANGFIYSQEWADTCARYGIRSGGTTVPSVKIEPTEATFSFVERMYTTAMKRASDSEGAAFWAGELANFKLTGEQVGVMFFLSDEMNGFGLSDSEFVTRLYKTFMDRDPEEGGYAFWVGYLNDGGSREGAVLGFTRSEEFVNKCVESRILPY